MDAGHIAGTVRLAAASVGVEAVINDDGDARGIEALLGLDGMSEGYLGHVALYDRTPGRSSHGESTPLPELPSSELPSPAGTLNREAPVPAEAVPGWPAGCRVRPSTRAAEIEIADIVTGRVFGLEPAALVETILAGDAPPDLLEAQSPEDESNRAALLPGLRHWNRRGWCPSDQFYVASRRVHAEDRRSDLTGTESAEDETRTVHVALPEPAAPGDHDIARLLLARRTTRAYTCRRVAASTLSGLLWYAFPQFRGETGPGDWRWDTDAWKVCLCIYAVEGVEPGTYWYRATTHDLQSVTPGDHRSEMIPVLQGMRSSSSAAWTLGLVADFPRYQRVLPEETGLRSLYTQAGVIAQEIIVLGGSYGLSTLVTPAQQDTPYLRRLHGLSRSRYGPIYTLTMGLSRGADGVDPDDSESS